MGFGSSGYLIPTSGPLLRLLRAFCVSTPEVTPLGLTAMEAPGKMGGRPRTATAIVADTQVGYDPHSMMWTTAPSSDCRPELPQPFKSAVLAAAVARREQASNAVTAASANAASPDAAADAEARTCFPTVAPPAPRSAGPQQGKKRPLWQPQPLPKPKATDFVVILKPRTQLSLATVFPENGAGRALIAHLGATATRLVTVGMVREQNLILTYTSNPQIADQLIGTYVSYDARLIPVQPYKKTVPACGPCGSIGHRPDACPGPKPDLCGICGKAVPLTDGARAPHECTPRCALCAGPHVTADRCCKERYRTPPPKSPTPPPEEWVICQASPKKRKRRRPRKPRKTGPRKASPQRAQPPATNPTPPPHPDAGAVGPSLRGKSPDGPPTRKSTARQVSRASPKPHPPSPEPKPTAQGDLSLPTHVWQGPQPLRPRHPRSVTPIKPPTPSNPTREQIAIRQLQAQIASLTQVVGALANRLPSPNPTSSGQAHEVMDSAPSERRGTTALLAPIEKRVSSLEAHVASIVITIKDRLAAALQTVVDRIPGKNLVRRWRRQKHNHQLKIRIAALTQEVDEYAPKLAYSN
ncbi:hypothetical protein HPB49_011871 [Dermacentor silvarum]|uniref:Uncharacterized protein n=1 Tax=Dermacentor silvarum TaxID=543639 RepID=A0ACB8DZF9_DERSI|nr:hypothetical protein HPB49_011871 [Dermacentor silvarum]